MDILSLIPYGMENAVNRYHLCNLTGLSEREVRQAIHNQSDAANPVINIGTGYFRPTDDDYAAVKRYVASEISRAASIEKKIQLLRQYLRNNDPDQLKMGVDYGSSYRT